jgi:hypothetical protein
VIAGLLGALLWSATAVSTVPAEHQRSFGGSLVLEDQRPLTVIDLATGAVTVSLKGIYTAVGANNYASIQAVPVSVGTMLVNRQSGTFNLLGPDNYLLDATGSGVGLGSLPGAAGAGGYAAGASAYIVRFAPHSSVTLVDAATVQAAAKLEGEASGFGAVRAARAAGAGRTVIPRGFASLNGAVADRPGAAAVSGNDLWALVQAGQACQVQRLDPVSRGSEGLLTTKLADLPGRCTDAAVEAGGGLVGVATPGKVLLFQAGQPRVQRDVPVPATAGASGCFTPSTRPFPDSPPCGQSSPPPGPWSPWQAKRPTRP